MASCEVEVTESGEVHQVRQELRVCAMVTVLLPSAVLGQVPDAWLPGGTPPRDTAVPFAPGLVSAEGEEYGVAVTEDWTEIYFTRLTGQRGNHDMEFT